MAEHFGEHMNGSILVTLTAWKTCQYYYCEEIQVAVSKAKALNADVWDSLKSSRQHPREWEGLRNNWSDIFPLVEVTVSSISE